MSPFRAIDDSGRSCSPNYPGPRPWRCPFCGVAFLIRGGPKVITHFAHRPGATCHVWSEPESAAHLGLKAWAEERFAGSVEFEVPVGDRRADALVSLPALAFTVECQASPISALEWEERTRAHNDAGYPVLWIWHLDRFRRLTWEEFRVPHEILFAHQETDGLVYVLDSARRLLGVTLGDAAERRGKAVGSIDYWVEPYVPRTIRRWLSQIAGDVPHVRHASSGLRLIEFGERRDVETWADRRQFTYHADISDEEER